MTKTIRLPHNANLVHQGHMTDPLQASPISDRHFGMKLHPHWSVVPSTDSTPRKVYFPTLEIELRVIPKVVTCTHQELNMEPLWV